MSNALAIAAVTASLKDLLNEGLLNHDLSPIGSFAVTAQPPDRVTTGETENNQLNLFLYQVSPNSGWRNVGLPSRAPDGTRTANPPLALDLHYLLTAYGAKDLNAEVLLGYAMQMLHENPGLSRAQLRTALGAPALVDGTILPGPFGTLSALDLADQVEVLKITPVYLSSEDLSKLWTSMQARYRPSMAYTVSVVLIQSTRPVSAPQPVLKRGDGDRGPTAEAAPFPTLASVRPALSELLPAARLGDDLVITGANLGGATALSLSCDRLSIAAKLPVTAGARPGELSAHLPAPGELASAMNDWGVGIYSASLRVDRASPRPSWTTNGAPLAISPLITVTPLAAAAGSVQLTVECTPRLRSLQEPGVRLLFGDQELAPVSISTPANTALPTTLTFERAGVEAGTYVVRLRVDGIDSLPVVVTGTPATFDFDPQQTVTVA